ncbi:hypothetical protein Desku_0972 [Desulfofundulus kuznetsovii DSM 6115]|uniref:Uncharacterized protein n=1 Tax=Desulfofundulus kuznetsovii (strain DSM 6115 / VKM B-1805 / 17) TaxID=760568 RepID=A0AAU8P9D2_DESK7|nr:hypothetical protein Desku_0972 [Desulfofundulus kuznetsovii DSM 6115]
MLRKLISWLLMTALVLGAVPYGAASALPGGEGEQVVKQEVIVGYFDIWKGNTWQDTNHDGTPDMPGQKGKTYTNTYSAAEKLKDWELTRVEVKYPFSPGEYEAAGGRQYGPDGSLWYDPDTGEPGMSWNWFHFWYLDHLPHNLSVKIASQDLVAGKAAVKWALDLAPLSNALNLKDSENRRYIGYEPGNFGELVEGWRWYLPAIITWYGVPKQQQLPDFYAKISPKQSKGKPGEEMTFTVTFGLKPDFPYPSEAILRAFHVVGDRKFPVTLKPLKNAPDPEKPVVFFPGEEKQYEATIRAQNVNSRVVVEILPAGAETVRPLG